MSNASVFECLVSVSEFCAYYSELCNVHTVDFITENRWNVLPLPLREELSRLNVEQLFMLLGPHYEKVILPTDFPELFQFVKKAKSHTIEAVSQFLPLMPLLTTEPVERMPAVVPSSFLMSPKKSHEVQEMSNIITKLAAKYNINTVVDFGNGKGYLSADLSLNHGLNVLGIDSSENNSHAADQRNMKLISRFICKKSLPDGNNVDTDNQHQSSSSNTNNGSYVGNILTIEERTDFKQLIRDFVSLNMPQDGTITSLSEQRVIYSCLHGCGNLFPCMLKHFISVNEAKVLCGVGCCYQHVKEQFCEDPFPFNGSNKQLDYGFPLSEILIKSKYCLGRNTRMLASQSLNRITKNTLRNDPLFYRTVLQVILRDYVGGSQFDFRVGKLATKCSDFAEYVQKALKRLGLDHLEICDEEAIRYLKKHEEEEKQLYAFQILRILMAPCVEALLLLDRLAFLLEKEDVEEAYVTSLFDPVISPRCYAVIAVKK